MPHQKESSWQIREIFLKYGTRKYFSTGQILVEKGQPANLSCYIAKGQVRTFCMNTEGDHVTLFYIEPDNMICSESLVPGSLVNVSVEAITPVEMYVIPSQQFRLLWEAQGFPIEELIQSLVNRLCLLSDYICCAHFKENKQKVAYFLHSCYDRFGPVIPYTNEQIADIAGLSRVSVNRILNSFSKEGLLKLEYKKIKILDVERLSGIFNSVGYFID